MSVIRTKTNMVVAHEPELGDRFIQIAWFGPGDDGKHARVFEGPPWPIDQYQQCVDWALSMADYMRFRLYVTPVSDAELRKIEARGK